MSPRILDQHGRSVFFPYDGDRKDLRKLYTPTVDVTTLRTYGAKFGKAVAVEPGITNIQTQSDFDTLLGGYNAVDGHRPVDVTTLTDGWRKVPKVSALGQTNTEIFVNNSLTVSAGQRYTEQFLFRSDAYGWPTFNITFFTNNGHHSIAPTLTHLGKGVWHAMATYVIESGGTSLRAIDIIINSWGPATYMDLTEPIVHLHAGIHAGMTFPVRTSHVWGTRAAGNLRYDGWLIPRHEGTVCLWLRPNYDYTQSEAGWRDLVRTTTTASSDEFRFTIGANSGTPGELQCRFFAGGASQKAFGFRPSVWDLKRIHHVALSWSSLETVLYLDGVRRNSSAGDFTRWSEASIVSVGCNNVTAEHCDGLIDDLAIFRRQLTDAQIAAINA